jgi:hypothetical protein
MTPMLHRILYALLLLAAVHAAAPGQPSPAAGQTSLGGYGELHYNEPDGSARGQLDFHRFVLFVSHGFNDRLSFRSEIEIEHTRIEAGEPEGGELSIEQALLDYRLGESAGIRAGILLPPVGIINLYHEPPTFHGVERPSVDRVIIPTTWREAGAGVYGTLPGNVEAQVYVTAGFDAAGFSAGNALRGGRQRAFESNPANPSVSGRLDYAPAAGLQLGASFFAGSSAADNDSIGEAFTTLWSADVRAAVGIFQFRGVGVLGTIGDAGKINAQFNRSVADHFYGWYVEGAANILPLLAEDTEQDLFLFGRVERYDTQAKTTGFLRLRQYARTDIVVGCTYRPVPMVAAKFDYSFLRNDLNDSAFPNTGQLNLGIGYFFY